MKGLVIHQIIKLELYNMAKKEKKFRQYRSNQGKSPERMENTYKGCFWIGITTILFLVVYAIFSQLFL